MAKSNIVSTGKDTTDPTAVEDAIRLSFDEGNFDEAATQFLQRFGGEILGYIVGRMGNAVIGSEVFSSFTEDFWSGLPTFKWRTSMRGWAYTLARNACCRYLNDKRRQSRFVSTDNNSKGFQLEAAKLRSATLMHFKTEVKSRMRELRERLPDDDQTLLILRVDQKLSWDELAVILSGEGDDMSDGDKKKWSAKLRKRFQSIKDRLRKMAIAEGLLDI